MLRPLKPFFSYFGGKYRIARKYPKPRWKVIIEPFAGSAGYSVRYSNRDVRLYDINPKVFGTWDYLIKVSRQDILSLPLVFDDVRELSICQEAKWLIGWWIGVGCKGPFNTPSLWMRRDMQDPHFDSPYNHTRWSRGVRSRIACQLHAIRHWKVFNKSYEKIPNCKATWFIDPPYQQSGKHYPFSQINYARLSTWAIQRSGQVIACGQLGDDWLPFRTFRTTRAMTLQGKGRYSKEVIWTRDALNA